MIPGTRNAAHPALLLIALSLAPALMAGDGLSPDVLSFNGYFKSFLTVFSFTEKQASWFDLDRTALASANNRLRIKVGLSPGSKVRFDAAYEIIPVVGDRELADLAIPGPGASGDAYRVADLASRIYPESGQIPGGFRLGHNLDRLSLTVRLPLADITFGRQVIAWGSARIVNPTDILQPFSFDELDKEERTGIDAVRIRVPVGVMSEIDAGWLPGPDFRLSAGAVYVRGRFPVWSTDASVLIMDFQDNLMIGLDLARSLGGAGLWLEASYVAPGAFRSGDGSGGPDYARISAGADYQVGPKTYAFVEYHFNGPGRRGDLEYGEVLEGPAYDQGSVYLLGRHYLGAGLSHQVTPLLPLTGLLLWNTSDGSAIALVTAEYNFARNVYLSAGAHLGAGRGPGIPEGIPGAGDLGIRSEFGLYPDLLFTSFRVYF